MQILGFSMYIYVYIYIHSFSKRLTYRKYIYLLFFLLFRGKKTKEIYISEMSTFMKTSVYI